ncbi:hypothetical protein [Mucilaginibacter gilvus]|uniref:Uncharacterized protein n=1 Tax=Mucilaginibacter gilvus TaxID=2305909 RepID=A0A3S3Z2H9_9SPHI|nr:hypothetical protein [Mucilaginibacter gilvus]RWY55772.1 hypothetical protein EPL05_05195 [Mucilaginibacter gilvus]
MDLGNKIGYYTSDDRLYICSSATAKARLNAWWDKQSESYKNQFNDNKANPNLIGAGSFF